MKQQPIKRDSFVFYRSFFQSISNCPDEAQLQLYRAIAGYGLNQAEPVFQESEFRPFIEAIWEGIRPQLDANLRRYLNGINGGAPKGSHNNPNGRRGKGTNRELTENKPNENVNQKENHNGNVQEQGLKIPFTEPEFLSTWEVLKAQPKWRSKTVTALQKCLDQLSRYDVRFAIDLMNTAIANNYQGVVFPGTDKDYQLWIQSHPGPSRKDEVVYTSMSDFKTKKQNE